MSAISEHASLEASPEASPQTSPMVSPKATPVYISSRMEKDNILTFTLTNIDVSLANAIRRTILADIPTLCFKTFPHNENNAIIHTNTSRFNNEILKQRLACIPIHMADLSLPYQELVVEIQKENTEQDIIYLTTEDFKIKNVKTEKYLKESAVKKIFPPNSMTKDFILFARLRPKISNEVPGEMIHIEATMSLQTAKENGMYNVVSCCSYGMTPDRLQQDSAWQEKLASIPTEDKEDAETLHIMKQDWYNHDAKRVFKPNSYDFTVETVGVFENIYIVTTACAILVHKLETILRGEQREIKKSNTTMPHSYDIILLNEGYTIGKLLELIFHDTFYKEQKNVTYVGFQKKHPYDTHSLIRVALADMDDLQTTEEIYVENLLHTACRKGIELLQQIVSDFE